MKITAFCLFSKTWISLLSLLRRRLQLNQLPTLKGLRHEYIPKLSVLISRFSQLWKNREIEDPRINIPARFKQAKLNTHTQNWNHRKKNETTTIYTAQIPKNYWPVNWYVPFPDCAFCCKITLICVFLVSFYLDILKNSDVWKIKSGWARFNRKI